LILLQENVVIYYVFIIRGSILMIRLFQSGIESKRYQWFGIKNARIVWISKMKGAQNQFAKSSTSKKETNIMNQEKKVPLSFQPEYMQETNQGVLIHIFSKPGAKQSRITDLDGPIIGVQIAAPPQDGKANEELLDFMSEVLGLKKRQLSLVKGAKERHKTLLITESTVDIISSKLKAACSPDD